MPERSFEQGREKQFGCKSLGIGAGEFIVQSIFYSDIPTLTSGL
jgi:hypothetical protein